MANLLELLARRIVLGALTVLHAAAFAAFLIVLCLWLLAVGLGFLAAAVLFVPVMAASALTRAIGRKKRRAQFFTSMAVGASLLLRALTRRVAA